MRLRGSDLLQDEARGGPEPRVEAREGVVSERQRRIEEVGHEEVLALLRAFERVRGAARAEDSQGTPTQSHMSPSIAYKYTNVNICIRAKYHQVH